ncbi:hypothetical protein B0H21DRAFT_747777 [Amylocystis lapponica]|nr:hypothetical protein B0H21DRAFT_747777 [Amylocystis lapponica]
MPPQPGVFALPYSSTHKAIAGPSSRPHGAPADDPKKERKRRDVAAKLGKEMNERREDAGRHYAEIISDLHSTSIQLSTRPESYPAYNLRLYPLTLERSALLVAATLQERHGMDGVRTAYEEEVEKVEEEWRRGRERIKERLLDGIEERRRRARDEKDGEGTVADAGLDSQSRPHNTRKLRNKLAGTSPPPTPLSTSGPGVANGNGSAGSGAMTSGPFNNPHSLSVDELPSPFPLPLTSTHSNHASTYGHNGSGSGGGNSRRRAKGAGKEAQAPGGLGKSLAFLTGAKESEVEHDLGEIRRGNKRRRVAANTLSGKG